MYLRKCNELFKRKSMSVFHSGPSKQGSPCPLRNRKVDFIILDFIIQWFLVAWQMISGPLPIVNNDKITGHSFNHETFMSLPVSSPTPSYWQIPPHRLASYRSPFPATADVVVIGSGITGTSVAKTLFEHAPSIKLVMLEARTLCSGATGRNGGHIKPGWSRIDGIDG